ncbi:hypothetical protein [Rhodospirillum centenum]|uniref:Uncharacterized protein n=1 Tax=Rhodospirillum centenum (strain ATCC 51521 / SW) TaxID=414684 RepID=B6IQP0_RHOCS|nr:hypothetical protein [Rhodospirillum centenum]ACI97776.1 hypothetical protein RC1_0329 [Rhodospirillum centenum SW]
MADAVVIQFDHITVGIAVAEGEGFRFFASDVRYYGLENRFFPDTQAISRACRAIRSPAAARSAAAPADRPVRSTPSQGRARQPAPGSEEAALPSRIGLRQETGGPLPSRGRSPLPRLPDGRSGQASRASSATGASAAP